MTEKETSTKSAILCSTIKTQKEKKVKKNVVVVEVFFVEKANIEKEKHLSDILGCILCTVFLIKSTIMMIDTKCDQMTVFIVVILPVKSGYNYMYLKESN